MFIDVPGGNNPILYVCGALVRGIGPAASAFAMSIYEHGTLDLPEFEAAWLRIAQVNGCTFGRLNREPRHRQARLGKVCVVGQGAT